MGQDIHIWMEYRRGDRWRMIKQSLCMRCGGSGEVMSRVKLMDDNYDEVSEECYLCDGIGWDRLREEEGTLSGGSCYHSGRNYAFFGALAPTGRRDRPALIEERGVPHDASPEFHRIVKEWNGDGHSHSWLNLDDVAAVLIYELEDPYGISQRELQELPYGGPFPWADRSRQHHMAAFIEQTVSVMQRIAAKRGPQNVRVVFFFDN